jgi:hypothetical protein
VHALTLSTLATKLPTLYNHLCAPAVSLNVDPQAYLNSMFAALFTTAVDLDAVTRLWDVWAFEGDAVLVRAAVAIFIQLENKLYATESRAEVLNILKAGPEVKREDEWMSSVRDAGKSGVIGADGVTPTTPNFPRSNEK